MLFKKFLLMSVILTLSASLYASQDTPKFIGLTVKNLLLYKNSDRKGFLENFDEINLVGVNLNYITRAANNDAIFHVSDSNAPAGAQKAVLQFPNISEQDYSKYESKIEPSEYFDIVCKKIILITSVDASDCKVIKTYTNVK